MRPISMQRFAPLWRSWSAFPQLFLHQLGWWACVLWMGWTGPLVMAGFLIVHLYVTRRTMKRETQLIAVSTLLGFGVDSTLGATGAVIYTGSVVVGWVPLWLLAIWAGFGATVLHSQAMLFKTRRHALLTGVLGGPLAYAGGVKLDRMVIDGWVGLIAIGALWTVAMLLLQRFAYADSRSV